jgi:hypothetical protein
MHKAAIHFDVAGEGGLEGFTGGWSNPVKDGAFEALSIVQAGTICPFLDLHRQALDRSGDVRKGVP